MANEQTQQQTETALASPKPNAMMSRRGIEPQSLDEAYRFAQALARSTIIPATYQKNPDNCLIAIDLAARMRSNWLAVMQHVYVVHGRPGLDANMSIGLVNQSGEFDPIQYEVKGDNPKDRKTYRVRAFSKRRGTDTILYGPWIDWELVSGEGWDKKDGSKWLTMPDQMFHYRAGSWWQKRHCPEMTLGMPTTDEIYDEGERKQIESMTLEPTKGRVSFGTSKPEAPQEQPQSAAQEQPQEQPAPQPEASAPATETQATAAPETSLTYTDQDTPPDFVNNPEPPSLPPFVCDKCGAGYKVKPAKDKCMVAKCSGTIVPNSGTWECRNGHKFAVTEILSTPLSSKGKCPICDQQGKTITGISPVPGQG